MRSSQIESGIKKMIALFHHIGFWHQGSAASPKQLGIKLFYCIFYALFPIALVGGAVILYKSGSADYVFLLEIATTTSVMLVRMCLLIWKQKEIEDLLNGICIFPIRYDEDFVSVDVKLRKFMTFVKGAVVVTISAGIYLGVLIPIITSENILFFQIAFPWDWKTNDIAYWGAVIFICLETIISIVGFLFSMTVWYLMLNCSLRYEVLASELRKMGSGSDERTERKIHRQRKENIFFQDLKVSIDKHLHIRKSIDHLESFCFELFIVQFCTGGLCICGSIYCLAFGIGENVGERLLHLFTLCYNISEIFFITCFGNEIMHESNRLSYSLFESDFVDHPAPVKKAIIIFGEYLKRPHELQIGLVYPLTLNTFTTILKGAYSMLNLLKNSVQ